MPSGDELVAIDDLDDRYALLGVVIELEEFGCIRDAHAMGLALLAIDDLPEGSKAALRRHERHVRNKYKLRNFLDVKAERGLASAAAYAFASQSNLIPIMRGVAADKLETLFRRAGIAASPQVPPTRFLMAATSAAKE